MREISTRTAQLAADMEIEPVITGDAVDWQKRFNQLQVKHLSTLRELDRLKNPVRSQDELERDFLAVRTFLDSMSTAEGAVTCAGVYGVAFLQRETDRFFVVKLCTELVRRYAPHQTLIQSTFDLWMNHAE